MSLREKLFAITLTIIFSLFAMIPIFEERIEAKESPERLYRVYLEGKTIGIIKSREAFESYINQEQKDLKEKYEIDNVYLPQGLNIEEYVGYSKNIISETKLYESIKDEKPFTIKGYVVTINKDNKPIKINVLNKKHFEEAISNTVKAFIPEKDFNAFINEEIEPVRTTGKAIEDLYIDEEITIKEALIPSDEMIFDNARELTQYLLFGNLEEQKEYFVKEGDTIESIAFDNSLGVEEFLVVNPEFNNPNNLLFVGQRVNIGLISPIVSIVKEEHIVEDTKVSYKTEIKYDISKAVGSVFVTQQGEDGLQRVSKKIKSKNGEITNAVITDSRVLKPTVNRVEVRGTRNFNNIVIGNEGDWFWPTRVPYIITSVYGYRWGRLHDGVDISGTGHGSPIYAANNGVIFRVATNSSLGHYVMIRHADNYYTIYAHLSRQYVSVGQTVNRGATIGAMGNTGYSFGTHLHFAVYRGVPYQPGSRSFNPLLLYR